MSTRWQLRVNEILEKIIRDRAEKNHRSINGEIIYLIEKALKEEKDSRAEIMTELKREQTQK